MEMLTGDASFHFHDFFPEDTGIKSLELVKTSKWDVHFPFGNSVWEFWSTFHEIPFSEEISVRGRPTKLCYSKKLPYIKKGIFKLLVLEKIESISSICFDPSISAWSKSEHKTNERRLLR